MVCIIHRLLEGTGVVTRRCWYCLCIYSCMVFLFVEANVGRDSSLWFAMDLGAAVVGWFGRVVLGRVLSWSPCTTWTEG